MYIWWEEHHIREECNKLSIKLRKFYLVCLGACEPLSMSAKGIFDCQSANSAATTNPNNIFCQVYIWKHEIITRRGLTCIWIRKCQSLFILAWKKSNCHILCKDISCWSNKTFERPIRYIVKLTNNEYLHSFITYLIFSYNIIFINEQPVKVLHNLIG